jgi:hypothetical protein
VFSLLSFFIYICFLIFLFLFFLNLFFLFLSLIKKKRLGVRPGVPLSWGASRSTPFQGGTHPPPWGVASPHVSPKRGRGETSPQESPCPEDMGNMGDVTTTLGDTSPCNTTFLSCICFSLVIHYALI